jgi:hypothetical protein
MRGSSRSLWRVATPAAPHLRTATPFTMHIPSNSTPFPVYTGSEWRMGMHEEGRRRTGTRFCGVPPALADLVLHIDHVEVHIARGVADRCLQSPPSIRALIAMGYDPAAPSRRACAATEPRHRGSVTARMHRNGSSTPRLRHGTYAPQRKLNPTAPSRHVRAATEARPHGSVTARTRRNESSTPRLRHGT